MKKKFALLLLGFMAASLTPAEALAEPLTVAVYDFKGAAGDGDSGSKVTALVTADLATQTNLVMLERAELEKALKAATTRDRSVNAGSYPTGMSILKASMPIKCMDQIPAPSASAPPHCSNLRRV